MEIGKQGLTWSRFVGKGLAEGHKGFTIKSATNKTEKPCVEFRHYFLLKTFTADLLKILCFIFLSPVTW